MAGAHTAAVVAVEILVEQDQIAPVRIVLEQLHIAVERAATVTIAPQVLFSLYGARQVNGQFLITISNAVIGKTYVVEAATNFAHTVTNTVWTPVGTNANASSTTFNILDPSAGAFRTRLYRGIER